MIKKKKLLIGAALALLVISNTATIVWAGCGSTPSTTNRDWTCSSGNWTMWNPPTVGTCGWIGICCVETTVGNYVRTVTMASGACAGTNPNTSPNVYDSGWNIDSLNPTVTVANPCSCGGY